MYLFSNPKGLKFIMLVGAPCSGKSTWLEKFLKTEVNGWTILSTDNIYEEYAAEKGLTYSEAFQALPYKKVKAKFRIQVDIALKNRENIIWDQTNVYESARRKKLSQVPKDYETIAVVFEVERGELDRRNAMRLAETGKGIPDKIINDMLKNYTLPTKAEGFSHVHIITE